ncbi:MAG TPA: hypothetical protein VIU62_13835, partial [Chloroflexota bacterium]
LAELAQRGVLLRPGGLNFISYSHTPADIDRTIIACRESLAALRPQLAPLTAGTPAETAGRAASVSVGPAQGGRP